MIQLKLKVGKSELLFDATNAKDIHRFSAIYGALPDVCDACKSEDIYLSHKAPSGNDYYMLKCKKCGAELNFHQKKEGGFYVKYGEKMQVYVPEKNGGATAGNGAPKTAAASGHDDDAIPFF